MLLVCSLTFVILITPQEIDSFPKCSGNLGIALKGLGWKSAFLLIDNDAPTRGAVLLSRGLSGSDIGTSASSSVNYLTLNSGKNGFTNVAILFTGEHMLTHLVESLTFSKVAYSNMIVTQDTVDSKRVTDYLGRVLKKPKGVFLFQCSTSSLFRVQTTLTGFKVVQNEWHLQQSGFFKEDFNQQGEVSIFPFLLWYYILMFCSRP
jgi:hypothetical protein